MPDAAVTPEFEYYVSADRLVLRNIGLVDKIPFFRIGCCYKVVGVSVAT